MRASEYYGGVRYRALGSSTTFLGNEEKTHVINPTAAIDLNLADGSAYRPGHEHYIVNIGSAFRINVKDSVARTLVLLDDGEIGHVLLDNPDTNRWIAYKKVYVQQPDRANVATAAAHYLGGIDSDANLEFNPVRKTWVTHGNMPNNHTRGSGFSLGGTVKAGYVHGDDAVPTMLTKITTPDTYVSSTAPGNRKFAQGGSNIGTFGFAIGGISGVNVVDNLDRFNGETDVWDVPSSGTLPSPRCLQAATTDGTNIFSLFGSSTTGFSSGVRETMKYSDSGGGSWATRRIAPYPGRIAATAFYENTTVYCAFGRRPDGTRISDLDSFDDTTNVWKFPPSPDSPASPRFRVGVCLLEGVAYFAGGDISGVVPRHSDELWEYHITAGVWRQSDADMPLITGDWNGQCNSIER